MNTRIFVALVVMHMASACATSSPRAQDARPAPPAEDVAVTTPQDASQKDAAPTELALRFEAAGGQPLPVPMVQATVAGKETLLIVDSGSSHHVLTHAFAKAAKVEKAGQSDKGTDHWGSTVEVAPLAPLTVGLASTQIDVAHALAIQGPPPFEKLCIGGFLAPHRMLDGGYVVMDFPGERMLLFADTTSFEAWRARQDSELAEVSMQTDERGNLYVPLALAGKSAALALLDTGGSSTEFTADYAGVALDQDDCEDGGECLQKKNISGQKVVFAGAEQALASVVIRSNISGSEGLDARGLVGMSVLRSCVVAIPQQAKGDVFASCAVEE